MGPEPGWEQECQKGVKPAHLQFYQRKESSSGFDFPCTEGLSVAGLLVIMRLFPVWSGFILEVVYPGM